MKSKIELHITSFKTLEITSSSKSKSPNDYKIFVSVTRAQRSCLVIGYSGTLRQDECCSSLRQYCSTRGLSCQPAWSRQDSIEKIHSELLDDRYRL